MTDHTDNTAPERIWAVRGLDGIISFNDYDNGEQSYVRADIFAATIADAERRGREAACARIKDLTDGSRQCGCVDAGCAGRHEERNAVLDFLDDEIAAILAIRTSPDTVPISWDTRPCRIEDME